MADAIALARSFGVRVEFADLGVWGACELRSEYDPAGPVIRINRRVLADLPQAQAARLTALAIGHELYHHREACGDVERIADRSAREIAADRFARELIAPR